MLPGITRRVPAANAYARGSFRPPAKEFWRKIALYGLLTRTPSGPSRLCRRQPEWPRVSMTLDADSLQAVREGLRFDLSEALRPGPRSAQDWAQQSGASERGSKPLLYVLASAALLIDEPPGYTLSPLL